MLKYNEWEALNESIGTGYALGVTPTQSLGLTGHRLSEWPVFMDDDDDEDEDDDDSGDEYNGELADDDEEGLEGDIMGGEEEDGIMGSEEGPNASFPPDDGDDMGGVEGDDDMSALLGDIDPDLAGLGDDELGPELTGGDLGGEEGLDGGDMGDMGGELGDEMGGELGDEMGLGGEEGGFEGGDLGNLEDGGELGDEMGGLEGELGDEMGGLEGELGDEMGMEEPCPECNPDGEMEEGDPACELCAGEGFVAGEDGGELDVGFEDEMGGMGGMGDEVDVEGEGIAMADLMHRMQDYMTRYMAPKMASQMGDHMSAGSDMQGGVPKMMMAKEGVMGAIGGGAAGLMAGGGNPLAGVAGAAGGHLAQKHLLPKNMSYMSDGDPNLMYQKKYMSKIAPDNNLAAKHKADAGSGVVRRPKHPIRVNATPDPEEHLSRPTPGSRATRQGVQRKFMGKACDNQGYSNDKNSVSRIMQHLDARDKAIDAGQGERVKPMPRPGDSNAPKPGDRVPMQTKFVPKCNRYCKENVGLADETHENFLASLSSHAKGEVRQKNEDALFQIVDPNALVQGVRDEPQAGEAGFAPQGRVGDIGGGYTPEDFSDIPVLGESRYITLGEFIAKKEAAVKK